MGAKATPLADVTFVVVDLETTGSIPHTHAITEIGAIKIRNGQILDRFTTLVNPEQDIPPFIQQLTGITPDMVADAPPIHEVMPAFWEFLGDGVFVAHHVPFDFKFLSEVTQRLLGEGLDNAQLCTCRLAKKLLPGLRRKNLDSVCQALEIEIQNRHRAMGDAEATAQVLLAYLDRLAEQGITTLGRLLDFDLRGGQKLGKTTIPFPSHRIAEFPSLPGVYLMRNQKGEILYIGKAKNLKRRLQSYYSNVQRLPNKVQELIPQVYDIETRILGSELEALLEESYLIKHHQPYYNRQIKNFKSFPFLKITTHTRYPQLSVTSEISTDDALYFGPYGRKRHLANMVDALSKVFQLRQCSDSEFKKYQLRKSPCLAFGLRLCSGPCVGEISSSDYHERVQEIVNFLEGRLSDLTERLLAERDAWSARLEFERAQAVQARLMELLKIQMNTQYLAQAVHQNHILIALPDRQSPRSWLLYVYKGRPIYKQVFDPHFDAISTITERVADVQRMLASDSAEKREVIQQTELSEIRIIAQWLRQHEPDPTIRIWQLTEPFADLVKQIHMHFAWAQPSPLQKTTDWSDFTVESDWDPEAADSF